MKFIFNSCIIILITFSISIVLYMMLPKSAPVVEQNETNELLFKKFYIEKSFFIPLKKEKLKKDEIAKKTLSKFL